MTETERLAAIEAIKQIKARYWRGVDLCDGELVRSVLAEDCELDYHGCCVDPQTSVDHLPAMNVTLRGRDKWVSDGMARFGIVSVHQAIRRTSKSPARTRQRESGPLPIACSSPLAATYRANWLWLLSRDLRQGG